MEVPSIFLNRILSETARKKAMSLHLTVGSQPIWRLSNELMPMPDTDIMTSDLLVKLLGVVLSEEEQAELAQKKELVVVKKIADAFRFRINLFYQKKLPAITFYYIPDNIETFAALNLPPIIADLAKYKNGLCIIAGSYGSGKTTTVASMIEEINRTEKRRIVTLENPVEYSFVSKQSIVEQRQVGIDTPTFLSGLRYCLEEDVDLVYVGDARENFDTSASLALELAAGNAMVIAEITASNVVKVIERLMVAAVSSGITEEVARHAIADVLSAVLVLKLLPRRGGGLIPAAEVLVGTPAIKSLIREGKFYQIDSAIQTSRKDGMINMDRAIEDLIRLGEVRAEDAKIQIG